MKSATPKRGQPLSFFFVYLIFHSTISEALVLERVRKMIGQQKFVKQRLQKNVLQRLNELE